MMQLFDRLEDKLRAFLSRRPILYALLSGIGIVLFFRGVWLIADTMPFMTGAMSLVIALALLLITGVFVSHFITEQIIISGIKKGKKLTEKTEKQLLDDAVSLKEIKDELAHIRNILEELKRR